MAVASIALAGRSGDDDDYYPVYVSPPPGTLFAAGPLERKMLDPRWARQKSVRFADAITFNGTLYRDDPAGKFGMFESLGGEGVSGTFTGS
jgi:hypothetical protein